VKQGNAQQVNDMLSHNQKKGKAMWNDTSSRWVKVGGLNTDWPNLLTQSGDLVPTCSPISKDLKSLQRPLFIKPLSLSLSVTAST
jgi:hypothetical protein